MALQINKYSLPSYWASYLINGDPSGLRDWDIAECDRATKGLGNCVDVSEEQNFGRYGRYGCDLSEYTFIIYPEKVTSEKEVFRAMEGGSDGG